MKLKISSSKKFIILFMVFTLIGTSVPSTVCMAKETETADQTATAALKAYKKFLKKNVSSFKPVESDFTTENTESYKTASYFLITDMDQDGIPELVTNHDIAYKMARLYVYTFKNGKMKRLKLKTADGKLNYIDVSSNADGSYEIYKDKKGCLHTDWSGSVASRCQNSTYTIKNGCVWCYLSEEKDESVSPVQHVYRINGKSTTAKKYLKKYKKLKKASVCWMLKNTSKNRKTIVQGTETQIQAEYEKADGVYGAYLKVSDKDKIGTTNEAGVFYEIVYDASINGDELIASGAMDYRNFKEQDPITVSSNLKHIFVVNESTIYQMVGGEDGPEVISKEEFATNLKEMIDSGLFLEVEVSNGVVTTASIIA